MPYHIPESTFNLQNMKAKILVPLWLFTLANVSVWFCLRIYRIKKNFTKSHIHTTEVLGWGSPWGSPWPPPGAPPGLLGPWGGALGWGPGVGVRPGGGGDPLDHFIVL